jgi:hypothetical protein
MTSAVITSPANKGRGMVFQSAMETLGCQPQTGVERLQVCWAAQGDIYKKLIISISYNLISETSIGRDLALLPGWRVTYENRPSRFRVGTEGDRDDPTAAYG